MRTGSKNGGLYLFDSPYPISSSCQTIANQTATCYVSKSLWHNRIGHPSDQAVDVLQSNLNFTKDFHIFPCDICHKAKHTREHFSLSDHTSTAIGKLVHVDLWVLTNLSSSVLNGKSPFEPVYGLKPKLSHLRNFGCLCFSYVLNNSDKFSASQVQPDVRRSGRNVKLPARFNDNVVGNSRKYGLEKYVSYSNTSAPNMYFSTNLQKSFELNTHYEALKDTRWVDAMNNEIEALNRNNTWTICDLFKGRKPVWHKWLFKIKYKSTCEDLFQLGINNASLYGDLSEDVYRTLPHGFDNDKSKVCKLNKSLYGIKQALRQWNGKLTKAFIDNGFVQSKFDYSLFTKKYDDVFIALLVYVDDIVITGDNLSEIEKFKLFLKSKFQIRDLVKLKYFLRIKVLDNKDGICLSQRKYCLELLHEYGFSFAEAEYRSMASVTCKVIWLSNLLGDIESFQENTGYWQEPNTQESHIEEVATSPTKNKKKVTRNRQKRTSQSVDAPRQTLWTTEEEIVLCKGWLAISENSKDGNAKKQSGFWVEILDYIESKTKQYGRRTYDMESGVGDEDYVQRAMIHYEIDTGVAFKLHHCWEILKDRPKWQEVTLLKFSTGKFDQREGTKQELLRGKKGSKSRSTSNVNEDALAKLMVTEMTAQEKEERLAFLDIKRREVEYREQELEQQDMRFYLQPYDHLIGDQRKAMDEI
nr:ribonuclease H-like domain-containing protein [Tanacetum cinerariifolium]